MKGNRKFAYVPSSTFITHLGWIDVIFRKEPIELSQVQAELEDLGSPTIKNMLQSTSQKNSGVSPIAVLELHGV